MKNTSNSTITNSIMGGATMVAMIAVLACYVMVMAATPVSHVPSVVAKAAPQLGAHLAHQAFVPSRRHQNCHGRPRVYRS